MLMTQPGKFRGLLSARLGVVFLVSILDDARAALDRLRDSSRKARILEIVGIGDGVQSGNT